MSLNLGSPAIEIAIGLAFVFFLLSIIVTAVTEWVAGRLEFRSKTLRKGLEGMLGDKDVVDKIFCHPLVRVDLQAPREGEDQQKRKGEKGRDPSYISPRNFALAFKAVSGGSPKDLSESLRTQLHALTGSDTALPDAPTLEEWFEDSMDRVKGAYKRKSQIVTIVIAIAVVAILNASTLRIAERLAAEPAVRAAVVAKSEGASQGSGDPEKAGEEIEHAVSNLTSLKLPLFWAGENVPARSLGAILTLLVGWAITIVAISLGAPFWFDALGKLSNLRMAGKKPKEEDGKPNPSSA